MGDGYNEKVEELEHYIPLLEKEIRRLEQTAWVDREKQERLTVLHSLLRHVRNKNPRFMSPELLEMCSASLRKYFKSQVQPMGNFSNPQWTNRNNFSSFRAENFNRSSHEFTSRSNHNGVNHESDDEDLYSTVRVWNASSRSSGSSYSSRLEAHGLTDRNGKDIHNGSEMHNGLVSNRNNSSDQNFLPTRSPQRDHYLESEIPSTPNENFSNYPQHVLEQIRTDLKSRLEQCYDHSDPVCESSDSEDIDLTNPPLNQSDLEELISPPIVSSQCDSQPFSVSPAKLSSQESIELVQSSPKRHSSGSGSDILSVSPISNTEAYPFDDAIGKVDESHDKGKDGMENRRDNNEKTNSPDERQVILGKLRSKFNDDICEVEMLGNKAKVKEKLDPARLLDASLVSENSRTKPDDSTSLKSNSKKADTSKFESWDSGDSDVTPSKPEGSKQKDKTRSVMKTEKKRVNTSKSKNDLRRYKAHHQKALTFLEKNKAHRSDQYSDTKEEKLDKSADTIQSPLSSIYKPTFGSEVTGKGYGFQKYKIPKLPKKEDKKEIRKEDNKDSEAAGTSNSNNQLNPVTHVLNFIQENNSELLLNILNTLSKSSELNSIANNPSLRQTLDELSRRSVQSSLPEDNNDLPDCDNSCNDASVDDQPHTIDDDIEMSEINPEIPVVPILIKTEKLQEEYDSHASDAPPVSLDSSVRKQRKAKVQAVEANKIVHIYETGEIPSKRAKPNEDIDYEGIIKNQPKVVLEKLNAAISLNPLKPIPTSNTKVRKCGPKSRMTKIKLKASKAKRIGKKSSWQRGILQKKKKKKQVYLGFDIKCEDDSRDGGARSYRTDSETGDYSSFLPDDDDTGSIPSSSNYSCGGRDVSEEVTTTRTHLETHCVLGSWNPTTEYQCLHCKYTGKKIVQHTSFKHPNEEIPVKVSEVIFSKMMEANEAFDAEFSAHDLDISWIPDRSIFTSDVKCKYCSYSAVIRSDLIDHIHKHGDGSERTHDVYNCWFCNFSSPRHLDFADHVSSHTGEYRFSCAHCYYKSYSTKIVKSHSTTAHGGRHVINENPQFSDRKEVVGYVCNKCLFIQLNENSVASHLDRCPDSEMIKIDFSKMKEDMRTKGTIEKAVEPGVFVSDDLMNQLTSLKTLEKSAKDSKDIFKNLKTLSDDLNQLLVGHMAPLSPTTECVNDVVESLSSDSDTSYSSDDACESDTEDTISRDALLEEIIKRKTVGSKGAISETIDSIVSNLQKPIGLPSEITEFEVEALPTRCPLKPGRFPCFANDCFHFFTEFKDLTEHYKLCHIDLTQIVCIECSETIQCRDLANHILNTHVDCLDEYMLKQLESAIASQNVPKIRVRRMSGDMLSGCPSQPEVVTQNQTVGKMDTSSYVSNNSALKLALVSPKVDCNTNSVISSWVPSCAALKSAEVDYQKYPVSCWDYVRGRKEGYCCFFTMLEKIKNKVTLSHMLQPTELQNLYKCLGRSCIHSTHSPTLFFNHVTQHVKNCHLDVLACCYCFIKIATIGELCTHIEVVHGQSKFQCGYCFYRAFSRDYAVKHQKLSHPGKEELIIIVNPKVPAYPEVEQGLPVHCYKCCVETCNFKSYCKDKFLEHLQTHNAIQVYRCSTCPFKTTSGTEFIEHHQVHGFFDFHCFYCEFGCNKQEDIETHLFIKHYNKPPKVSARTRAIKVKDPTSVSRPLTVTTAPTETPIESSSDTSTTEEGANKVSGKLSTEALNALIKECDFDEKEPNAKFLLSEINHCCFKGCNVTVTTVAILKEHISVCDYARNSSDLSCFHCNLPFKNITAYVNHIRGHMKTKYICEICKFESLVRKTVYDHIVNTHSSDLLRKQEEDMQEKTKNYSEPLKRGEMSFGPDDEDNIPRTSIFKKLGVCCVCGYSARVRINMVRHLKMHKVLPEDSVPLSECLNPIPMKETSERMFDKMNNWAESSHLRRNTCNKSLSDDQISKLPILIPEEERFICRINGCNYLTVDDTMLKYHLAALHSDVSFYPCPHCDLTFSTVDKVTSHLKLHGSRLYACGYCLFHHHQQRYIERHMAEKHGNRTPFDVVVREPVVDSLQEQQPEKPKVLPEKYWKCGLCSYITELKSGIVNHTGAAHGIHSQYKCALCHYKSQRWKSYIPHFAAKHPGEKIDIIAVYHENDDPTVDPNDKVLNYSCNFKDKDTENAPTTPLWSKNPKRIKHIRGILIDFNEISIPEKPKVSATFPEIIPSQGDFYLCPKCKKFRTKVLPEFLDHVYREMKYQRYVCTHCGIMATTETHLKSHSARNHPDRPEAISALTPDPVMEKWVEKMVAAQKGGVKSSATVSESSLSKVSTLNATEPATSMTHKCNFCASVVKTETGLKHHINFVHMLKGRFICRNCNFTFDLAQELHDHINNKLCCMTRKSQDSMPADKGKFSSSSTSLSKIQSKCGFCDHMANTVGGRLVHEKTHFLKKPYKCPHCDVDYQLAADVKSHCKVYHPGRRVYFVCKGLPKEALEFFSEADRRLISEIEDRLNAVENNDVNPNSVKVEIDNVAQASSSGLEGNSQDMETLYGCYYCPFKDRKLEMVRSHWEARHKPAYLEGKNLQFKYKSIIRKQTTVVRPMLYKCSGCEVEGSIEDVKLHVKDFHHEESKVIKKKPPKNKIIIQCNLCTQRFSSKKWMENHFNSTHPGFEMEYHQVGPVPADSTPNSTKFQCGWCRETFLSYASAERHHQFLHSHLEKKIIGVQESSGAEFDDQDVSGESEFISEGMDELDPALGESDVEMDESGHGKDDTAIKIYHCPLCSHHTFKRKYIHQHLKRHVTIFICKECGENYPNKPEIRNHFGDAHPTKEIDYMVQENKEEIQGYMSRVRVETKKSSPTKIQAIALNSLQAHPDPSLSYVSDVPNMIAFPGMTRPKLNVARKSTSCKNLFINSATPRTVAKKSTSGIPRRLSPELILMESDDDDVTPYSEKHEQKVLTYDSSFRVQELTPNSGGFNVPRHIPFS